MFQLSHCVDVRDPLGAAQSWATSRRRSSPKWSAGRPQWAAALNRMRWAEPTSADLALVNARTRTTGDAETSYLPNHRKCGKINLAKLRRLDAPLVALHADVGFCEILQRFPWKANRLHLPERTPQIPDKWPLVLSLKVGARVRCLRLLRDGELETASNQLGTVVDIDAQWNEVTVRDGRHQGQRDGRAAGG